MTYGLVLATGVGHVKFIALAPCVSEPEDPLIQSISADDMPDNPDKFLDDSGSPIETLRDAAKALIKRTD
jgi:hypothetical protein